MSAYETQYFIKAGKIGNQDMKFYSLADRERAFALLRLQPSIKDIVDEDGRTYGPTVWSTFDKDMKEGTTGVPSYVYHVTGVGEDRDDTWARLYHNGDMVASWEIDTTVPSLLDMCKKANLLAVHNEAKDKSTMELKLIESLPLRKMPGLYLVYNKVSNKTYVGSAYNMKKRFKQMQLAMQTNACTNRHLNNSVKKHGMDAFSFEILMYCPSPTLQDHFIDLMCDYDNGSVYNYILGMSEEVNAKVLDKEEK